MHRIYITIERTIFEPINYEFTVEVATNQKKSKGYWKLVLNISVKKMISGPEET